MKYAWMKRVLSLMMALVMVVGMLPMAAFAEEAGESTVETIAETTAPETEAATVEAAAEATEQTTVPTEEETVATEAETEPTEAETEATEAETEPAEAETEATEAETEPTEVETEATEAETEPAEEETEATEAETEPAEEATEPTEVEILIEEVTADAEAVNGVTMTTMDDIGMTVVTDKESTLAPGVTMNEIVLYNEAGNRVEMYVTTTDLSVESVGVYANYKDNQNVELGMSKLTEQVVAAEKKHEEPYTVVAAINASYYNMITGKPTGTFVMEGNDITTESEGNSYSFFAVLKDGTAMIGGVGDYSKYKGQIAEAVGGYYHIVKDGAVVSGLNDVTLYPRQTVGVTADGRVITMTADGNQAPKSVGLTIQEQAEVMVVLGCVEAIHLDGGGSCTFGAKAEGADSFEILNSPSDGSERSISNALMIVSTAVADGTFDHATLTAAEKYVTPGSSVAISAIGVDAAGGSAEVPAEITWQVANAELGTVTDGVFTSSGTAGDAVVQMVYNGEVVGETTIHVVIPESLTFNSAQITIPYGKSVVLEMTAYYGVNEVALKDGDVTFTMADETAGTMEGFVFTANEVTASTGTKIQATLVCNPEITASAEILLGKGSEVLFDFEDGTDGGLLFSEPAGTQYNYVWPESDQWIVTANSGKVHSGEKALAMKVNYGNSLESGYMKTSLVAPSSEKFENTTGIGMWIYIPDEAVGLWARWTIRAITGTNEDGTPIYGDAINGQILDGKAGGTGSTIQFDESGWHYLSVDTSAYPAVGWKEGQAIMQFYISDRDGAAFNYYFADQHNINGVYTFYVDDITVDYSSAVDDRDAPVFSSVVYANSTMADAAELNGQTSTNNTLSFTASVADVAASNSTGIKASTAKAYVDGNLVSSSYHNGKISVDDMVLADGIHTVKFSICDNQGNYASEIRTITVNAGSGMSTVKLVPHDASQDRILLGSLYYVDVVATDIEKVQSVVTTLDLDNMSVWNLAHMEAAEGFTASYFLEEEENIATVTITRTGESTATGEAALVSIPIRTWELKTGYTYENGTKAGQAAMTYAQFRNAKEFWPIAIDVEVDKGLVTFTDGTTGKFSGAGVVVDTEMWANYGNMTATSAGTAYFNAWNGGHLHSAETLEDKAPGCTEKGYSGRTFCAGCNSVVAWGVTLPATGHSYGFVDGLLMCTNGTCGKLFNGAHTDGKFYVDGVLINDGWNGDSYYLSGEKLTGVRLIDGFYHDFGEDGVCKNQAKYTGLFFDETIGAYRYSKVGVLTGGWVMIGEDWYYFRESTLAAPGQDYAYWDGTPYEFEETGKLVSGLWITDEVGSRYYYGPGYYTGGGAVTICSWYVIDGKTYCIDKEGYRYEGLHYVIESNSSIAQWYDFGEDGALVGPLDTTGLIRNEDGIYYAVNGISKTGLVFADGHYYYFRSSTKAACVNETYTITNTNGINIELGEYTFDENGHMLVHDGIVEIDGTLYYYENGIKTYAGLIEIDGSFYYVRSNYQLATGRYYVTKTNDLMSVGYYEFDENGKMILETEEPEEPEVPEQPEEPEVLNGIVEEDGVLYYYVDGAKSGVGLFVYEGDFYYARSSGQVVTGEYYVSEERANGLLSANTYCFGEDGRMLDGIAMYNDALHYFETGVKVYAGLIKIDGDIYYVRSNCQLAIGRYYVTKTNDLLTVGYYEFDENGKMILETEEPEEPEVPEQPEEPEVLNGIVEENGVLYYYVDGAKNPAGLFVYEGDFYYARSSGQLAIGEYYVSDTRNNGLLPANTYCFGEDGKLLDGIAMYNGALHYFETGVKVYAGLIEIDGNLYYVRSNYQLATGRYYVTKTNGLMSVGYYTFDDNGVMIPG